MQILKRASCALCGEPLTSDNALKHDDMLICTNPVCMKLNIRETEYNCLCNEFAEDIYPEKFYEWVEEVYFDKPEEDEIEYYEEYEPECDHDD